MMTLIRTPTWGKHQEIRRIEATPELLEEVGRWNGAGREQITAWLEEGKTVYTNFAQWRKA